MKALYTVSDGKLTTERVLAGMKQKQACDYGNSSSSKIMSTHHFALTKLYISTTVSCANVDRLPIKK